MSELILAVKEEMGYSEKHPACEKCAYYREEEHDTLDRCFVQICSFPAPLIEIEVKKTGFCKNYRDNKLLHG